MNTKTILWLLPILAGVALWLVGTLKPAPTITIELGNEAGLNAYGQGDHLYNFFGWGNPGTEQGKLARRIEPVASFVIPRATRLGEPLTLDITMCGCGSTEPVTLTINGVAQRVALAQTWQSQQFDVPPPPDHTPYDLYIEWQSDARPRPLVHQVVLRAQHPDGGIAGPLLVGVCVALLLLLTPHQMTGERLAWVGVIIASAGVGRWLYQPQLLPWVALLLLGGAAALAVTLLSDRLWRRLLLWVLVVWILAAPQLLGTWILDDAFISFRYASNLINGDGLTFNPGGERVEGYTNFLWTILVAGGLAVGFEPVLMAQILCSGLAIATLLLVQRLAEDWWPERWWNTLPAVLLAINPSFMLYTARGSGMETALVTLLSTAALWALWRAEDGRSGVGAGLLCALAMMTRPDAALLPMAGVLVLAIQRYDWATLRGGPSPLPERMVRAFPVRTLAGVIGGVVLLYGPYFLWRYTYYGYLLPNTFYAKTGMSMAQVERGFAYTREFVGGLGLRSLLVLLGLSVAGMVWPAVRRRVTVGPAPLLWLFALLTAGYVTIVGGDHFPLGRFFVPVVPALVLLITHGVAVGGGILALAPSSHHTPPVRWALQWGTKLPLAVAVLAVLLLVALQTMRYPTLDSRDLRGRIWGENYVALKNREIGTWMQHNTPPDTVIATGIAGALPYYAQRHVIDALGLNDVYIAHMEVETIGQGIAGAEKTDPHYILRRAPDYIPHATSGEFLDIEQFQQEYTLMTVRGPEGGEILLYKRQ